MLPGSRGPLTAVRRRVLEAAADGLPSVAADLARRAGCGAGVVRSLATAGFLETVELPGRPSLPPPDWRHPGPQLSSAQEIAAQDLQAKVAAGGFSALRFGYMKTLIAGVIMKILVIANFATMAWAGPDLRVFGAVILADNFGIGFAGVALVTYMSSLTSLGYTATQYALLSSAYTYVGKLAKGFSGVWVERLAAGRPLLEAYGLFFIGAGLLGVPALILCLVLARATRDARAAR